MIVFIKKIMSLVLSLSLIGCSMNINNFTNSLPELNLFDYFDGKTTAWGIFEDRFGTIQKQFRVNIIGKINGDHLILDEKFIYNNGDIERRVWNIKKVNNNSYEGKADDIEGIAKGTSNGNALNWQYDMNIKIKGRDFLVHFNDWMFLQDNGVLINRAKVTKWGFKVGEISLFFHKKID